MKAVLVLEDGTYYSGEAFGAEGDAIGEIVFNTCMTGYQEITTDPSYNGQLVAMTYPLIGNYGFNNEDTESFKTHVEGFIVKELCEYPNNWRNSIDNNQYFKANNIVGIKSIDTRALTQHIRNFGSMFGIISTKTGNVKILLDILNQKKSQKHNLVMEVTTKTPVLKPSKGKKVVVMDFGVKYNIIRELEKLNCSITVLPAYSSLDEIMEHDPDGILLSNGPGDPEDIPEVIKTVKKLIGKKPILGICLGHQILGLALNGKICKLKFGHHGGNHPVKNLKTGKCYITSQNHNYALQELPDINAEITHINLNDNTIEGFTHEELKILSIQYHPEASPGPQDSSFIFNDFVNMLDEN